MEKIELLTKAEAAELLAISEDTVDRLIKGGQLPAYRIAKTCTRLDRRDVLEYLESRKIKVRAVKDGSSVRARHLRELRERMPSGYKPGMKVVDPNG